MNRLRRTWLFVGAIKSVIKSRFWSHRPFFVSHLITTRCFAKCPTCLWRGNSPEEKDTAKVIEFYREARQEGFVSTTFWGGEPLLREDIFDILKACQKLGLVTGVITNGYLLPKYYRQLVAHLDFLIVSIDIPSQEHDRLRGVEGIFHNAIEGLKLVKAENPRLKIFLNSVVSKLNYPHVDGLTHLAESLETSITFESVNTGQPEFARNGGAGVVDFRLPGEKEKQLFRRIRLLKAKHSCINNSTSYLKLFESGKVNYRCHAPKISIRVEPNGDVTNCLDRRDPIGNVYQDKLGSIIRGRKMRWLQQAAEGCCRCVDSGTIESSLFWDFNPEAMLSAFRLFLR